MKKEYTIHRAKRQDLKSIFKIGEKIKELKFSKKHFHEVYELKEGITHPRENILLVAESDKEIIGFLYAKILSKDRCMLDNLAVNKTNRNKGIGKDLLKSLYKILKKEKVDYIQILEEIHHKKTRKFWQDNGFKKRKVFIWADKIIK